MHRNIIEFYRAWCGSHHITLRDQLCFFPLAHCTFATQLRRKMLADTSYYNDFVQCQSHNLQTWHRNSHLQGFEKRISLHHHVEYKFWFCPDDIKHCVGGSKYPTHVVMSFSTQHMVGGDWNQSIVRGGVGAWGPLDFKCIKGRHFHLVTGSQ